MSQPTPPVAERRPHELTAFGHTRSDDYYWMRDREDNNVIAYLEAENAYADQVMQHLQPLRQTLFDEIKARVQETDESPASPWGDSEYYSRTEEGKEYSISCRRPRGGGPEQVLLDENELAGGHEYFSCEGPDVSPNHRLALYATDTNGSERYDLRVRDLSSGEDLPDLITDISRGAMAWATDSATFFYARHDDALRPFQVWRHVIGADPASDELVYEDLDERFFVGVQLSESRRFVFVVSRSKVSYEWSFIPASEPTAALTLVEPRADGLEYMVTDDGTRLVIVTNADGAVDFKVVTAPTDSPGRSSWVDLIPPRDGVKISGVTPFADHLVISLRSDALRKLVVLETASSEQHEIEQDDAVYTTYAGENLEFATTTFRYIVTSPSTPTTWVDYDLETRERTVVKQTPVLGGFDAADYTTERTWAKADDGTLVPISLLYRRDLVRDGNVPVLLYGYGSYEISIDPTFSTLRLNLVDRGMVFAIAHIRGGGELGRRWYDNGKMQTKRNTFTDFIACARHLVDEGWTQPGRIVARGGSAGGLLMGAVVNMAPELFAGIVAEVPFVDVVTTMSDESIPLTVTEWEEWGNPRDVEADYHYMLGYSPYDNVEAKDYPPVYISAGLNDPRVQYWEPAKWTARLRATKTDSNPLLLKTEMGAGHGGPSGRYGVWEDEARVQAFILDQVGITI